MRSGGAAPSAAPPQNNPFLTHRGMNRGRFLLKKPWAKPYGCRHSTRRHTNGQGGSYFRWSCPCSVYALTGLRSPLSTLVSQSHTCTHHRSLITHQRSVINHLHPWTSGTACADTPHVLDDHHTQHTRKLTTGTAGSPHALGVKGHRLKALHRLSLGRASGICLRVRLTQPSAN